MVNLTINFTENDYVAVLAGQNDFSRNKTTNDEDFDISIFEEVAKHTNIIFAGIPLR